MVPGNDRKKVMIQESGLTAAATASGYIDTLGYDFLTIDLAVPTGAATTDELATCDLYESTSTTFGTGTTVDGAVSGTDWTIPAAVTSGTQAYSFNVHTTGEKERYIHLYVVATTTQDVVAIATLSRAKDLPVGTATNEQAITAIIRVA